MTAEIINRADVERLGDLARVGLCEAEVQRVAADLEKVLHHFSLLQKIDTSTVGESYDVTGLVNVWREDVVDQERFCDRDALLNRAPAVFREQIQVRAVFD